VPILQKAVVTLIVRTRIMVEVLTGTFYIRPDVQHLQRVSQTHVMLIYTRNLTPFNSTFFRQR